MAMEPIRLIYRGYDIHICREECMIGFYQLYYSVFRQSDLHFCKSGYVAENTCVKTLLATLEKTIDSELQKSDPWQDQQPDIEI